MQRAIWLYPWDFFDGGPEAVLDEIVDLGLSEVHLTASYHTLQAVLPHNPRRRTYLAERGALYFRPEPRLWEMSPLRPALSSLLDKDGDALAVAAPLCKERGLRLVAWTVCLHSSDLGYRHPWANVVNLRGEQYRYSLCAANPGVREYLRILVTDLRDRVDAIELEAPHWLPFPHHHHAKLGVRMSAAATLLLTLCFCGTCRNRLGAAGVDSDRLADRLATRLDQYLVEPPKGDSTEQIERLMASEPDLDHMLAVREQTITSLIAELVEAAGPTPVQAMPFGPAWLSGANPAEIAPLVERLVVLAYGSPAQVAATARDAMRQVPSSERLSIGLSLLADVTPDRDSFHASLVALRAAGVQYVSFYNYGLSPAERLRWVKEELS